jgi:hypothetical protein
MMRLSLLQRTIVMIILIAALLPVSLAFGGLPGPLPPAPPPIPTPPLDSEFDYVKVDDAQGQAGVAEQLESGTELKDKIIQYGGTDNVLQSIYAGAGDDWLLQVGGDQATTQLAQPGTGNNTIYQFGGQGDSNMLVSPSDGNDTIIQVGGQGSNRMNINSGDGADYIEQYGGSGNNLMRVTPGFFGDDVIKMYGGPGNNSMTYDVSAGNDLATILGGGGYNTLTINKNDQNFTLKDYQGRVLFQTGPGGSIITVANLQHITVIGDAGKVIYTYNGGIVPTSIAPLLLLGN